MFRNDHKTNLIKFEAFTPFLEGDFVITVCVTRVKERRNAVLKSHKRCPNGKELVPRNGPIVRMTIEITPLPHRRRRPAQSQIGFGLTLHFRIIIIQFLTICQVPHDVKQPITHTARKVNSIFFLTSLKPNFYQHLLQIISKFNLTKFSG